MTGTHALASPSGYDRWSVCAGSIAMESGEPDGSNVYSDEGTAAHFLASESLIANKPVAEYMGKRIIIFSTGAGWLVTPEVKDVIWPIFTVDEDMVEAVSLYTNAILNRIEAHKLAGAEVQAFYEQRLPLEQITGEKGAHGTADTVILATYPTYAVLEVHDLKYGMGVKVSAFQNGQLQIYACAARLKYGTLLEFTDVVLAIHQPRVNPVADEWRLTVQELGTFMQHASVQARLALQIVQDGLATATDYLVYSEDGCRFCKAKTKCPAYADMVHGTVFGEFQDITDKTAEPVMPDTTVAALDDYAKLLPLFMARVKGIEDWCTAIRAKVEALLLAGKDVAGWKLVEGRRGARSWRDVQAVEKLLVQRQAPIDKIYEPKELKSVAQMEKVLAKKMPALWETVAELVVQKDGKPSVAPANDERPTWSPVAAGDFESHDGSDLV